MDPPAPVIRTRLPDKRPVHCGEVGGNLLAAEEVLDPRLSGLAHGRRMAHGAYDLADARHDLHGDAGGFAGTESTWSTSAPAG